MTGADIRNLVNEAALWAARNDQLVVHMIDFEYARDKSSDGRRSRRCNDRGGEKDHGLSRGWPHAAGLALRRAAIAFTKSRFFPRGRALGVTQLVPEEERYNISQHDLQGRLAHVARRSRGRAAAVRPVQRRRRKRLARSDAPRAPDGHPLGHERTPGPGRLSQLGGSPVPGPRNGPA